MTARVSKPGHIAENRTGDVGLSTVRFGVTFADGARRPAHVVRKITYENVAKLYGIR